jgi:glucosamine-6-phosphate deaminase
VIAVRHGTLRTEVLADRRAMGDAAAAYVAARLRDLLDAQDCARVLFAAAPSQSEFLDGLATAAGIDWSRVEAFQLDEYVGLPPGHPQSFGAWLGAHIWSSVRPGRVEILDGSAAAEAGPDVECARYGTLLGETPIDVALIGVGENGHLAFNDPHVADFDDPLVVKPVAIDDTSRAQQVRDGAFPSVDEVPSLAMTVTMSTILGSRVISAVVPGAQKATAVARMLEGPIETACPASALRRHPDAVMFVDAAAFSKVPR